jgi:putative transposase
MSQVNRKVTYRLYPSKKQSGRMQEMLRLHQRLYNACLEQRIHAYKDRGISLNFSSQCKELTALREEFSEYRELNAQSGQVTLKRLDRAYQNFFRRVKKGEEPGFPRFKSFDRFSGWGYKSHGDGWSFKPNDDALNGTLRLSSVGNLQARGRARKNDFTGDRWPGTPKTMEIIHKHGKWFASVTFKREMPERASGESIVGIDWGTSKFLTIVDSFGNVDEKKNPRLMKKFEKKLQETQRNLSKKKIGSKNRLKVKKKLLVIHEKLANKREDHLHKKSSEIIRSVKLIATEKLNIKNMTASGGCYKKGLNRSILDTSPGNFFAKLEYKAEEAGIQYVKIPTRKVKPSQTCACCGNQEKKLLSERTHDCKKCGFICDRDVNAALVMINYALTGIAHSGKKVTGQELALGLERAPPLLKDETPSIFEQGDFVTE